MSVDCKQHDGGFGDGAVMEPVRHVSYRPTGTKADNNRTNPLRYDVANEMPHYLSGIFIVLLNYSK